MCYQCQAWDVQPYARIGGVLFCSENCVRKFAARCPMTVASEGIQFS